MGTTDSYLIQQVETLYTASGYDAESMFDGSGAECSGHANAIVYGEVTTPLRLFKALELGKDDVFADIGSGRGQLVLAAAMADPCPRMAYGVELVSRRHRAAIAALQCAEQSVRERASFYCDDALAEGNSAARALAEASKVFLNNTTFGQSLNASFAKALHPSRAPSLVLLATIAPLDSVDMQAAGLALARLTTCCGQWCPRGTALYVYGRRGHVGEAHIDSGGIEQMLAGRAESAQRAAEELERQRNGGRGPTATGGPPSELTEAQFERGLLRNSILAAAMRDALVPRAQPT